MILGVPTEVKFQRFIINVLRRTYNESKHESGNKSVVNCPPLD